MVIFHSYVSLPEGNHGVPPCMFVAPLFHWSRVVEAWYRPPDCEPGVQEILYGCKHLLLGLHLKASDVVVVING